MMTTVTTTLQTGKRRLGNMHRFSQGLLTTELQSRFSRQEILTSEPDIFFSVFSQGQKLEAKVDGGWAFREPLHSERVA